MTATDLRDWVGLFVMDMQADGQGGFRETTPGSVAQDLPANVRQVSATEVPAQDQLSDRVRYVVTVRYQPGITSVYRVSWGQYLLDVTGVQSSYYADGAWLELQCERREAGTQ